MPEGPLPQIPEHHFVEWFSARDRGGGRGAGGLQRFQGHDVQDIDIIIGGIQRQEGKGDEE